MTDIKRKYVGRTLEERIKRADLTAINHEALAGKLIEGTTLYIAQDCISAVMLEEFADRIAYALYILGERGVSLRVAELGGHDADYRFTIMRDGFSQLGFAITDRVGGVAHGHYTA